jgi:hypothetical protein
MMLRCLTYRLFLLSAAFAVPGLALAQAARESSPVDEPATVEPALPAGPTAPVARVAVPPRAGQAVAQEATSPRAAVRARTQSTEAVQPTLAAPVWSPSALSYYTQNAPQYRYTVPVDKEMQELHKKESELSKKTSELVGALKGATSEKKAEIKTELVATVEKHFAVRQEQRELQLKRIEEEVKKLREAIEKRNTAKKELIERRVAELTGEDTIGF